MITSKQNDKIKGVRALKDKKERDRTGLFTVESAKLVKEALSRAIVVAVVGTEKGLDKVRPIMNAEEVVVSEDVFKSLSSEISPEGVLAVVKKPQSIISCPKGSCVFLDGVSDPANVGAIIRTAAAVGITDVFCCDSADPFSPKSVRASMGGIFRVNVVTGGKDELLSVIDKPIVVADMGGENVFKFNIKGDFCLVIGNEAHGVSGAVKMCAAHTVAIPMQNGMESLNAAVSAGILMYALTNQN